MKIYRIVWSYETMDLFKADVYYVRAENEEQAREKFKEECPLYKIESIRDITD